MPVIERTPYPRTATLRCGYCEDTGKTPVAFVVTTEPGAISEHWCGMKIRWTGVGSSQMEVVHDPGTGRAIALLALLALPTAVALMVAGPGVAGIAAIGTLLVLAVWRLFLLPGLLLLSDIVDAIRGLPPDQYASRNRRWW